jgi:hypothetical protein
MAIAALCVATVHGLDARERRIVVGILVAAAALRLAIIAGFFLVSNHALIVSFPWDSDGLYIKWRAATIRDLWAGLPVGPAGVWEAFHRSYGWSSYINVLAYIQYLIGSSPYGVHLVNAVLSLGSAALLYRAVRPAVGERAAIAGLVVLLFLPTLLSWSVTTLKDTLYVFLGVLGLAAVVVIGRAKGVVIRLLALAVVIAAIAANATVRSGAHTIMMGGIGVGLVLTFLVQRPIVLVVAVITLLVAGPLGLRSASARARIDAALKQAATLHVGYASSGGNVYRLLDQRLYVNGATLTMTPGETARFVIRAGVSFFAVPLPWQVQSGWELLFLPQQIVWYVLVIFAVPGFVVGLQRDALVSSLLFGMAVVGATVIALTGGNIGTTARLRDTVVPFILWFSALGAEQWAAWCLPAVREA